MIPKIILKINKNYNLSICEHAKDFKQNNSMQTKKELKIFLKEKLKNQY